MIVLVVARLLLMDQTNKTGAEVNSEIAKEAKQIGKIGSPITLYYEKFGH